MTDEQPVEKKRSKKIYVYWGVALTLLLALGLFSWLVVVPYLEARTAARESQGGTKGEHVIQRLGGPERAGRALRMYLSMPDWLTDKYERSSAVYLLGFSDESSVPKLRAYLNHPDRAIRSSAIGAFYVLGPKAQAAVPQLLLVLRNDPNKQMRISAAGALAKIAPEDKRVVWGLAIALNDQEEIVASMAAHWLSEIGPPAAIATPRLATCLTDKPATMGEQAALALAEIGPGAKSAVPALRKALTGDNKALQVFAAKALWRIERNPEEVIPTLLAGLDSKDVRIQGFAIYPISEIGPKARAARPQLLNILKGKLGKTSAAIDDMTRTIARGHPAFGGFAKKFKGAMLNQISTNNRAGAAIAIGNIGAAEDVPALEDALNDPSPMVRQAAAEALKKIREKENPQP